MCASHATDSATSNRRSTSQQLCDKTTAPATTFHKGRGWNISVRAVSLSHEKAELTLRLPELLGTAGPLFHVTAELLSLSLGNFA
jgi:hypothetical protein